MSSSSGWASVSVNPDWAGQRPSPAPTLAFTRRQPRCIVATQTQSQVANPGPSNQGGDHGQTPGGRSGVAGWDRRDVRAGPVGGSAGEGPSVPSGSGGGTDSGRRPDGQGEAACPSGQAPGRGRVAPARA